MNNRFQEVCRLPEHCPGLQQMICYALANPGFAECLVREPLTALAQLPAEIHLSNREYALVRQMDCTTSLHWFAAYLHLLIEEARACQNRIVGL